MFACDIFDILSLNLACADRSLKNKRSMVICFKIGTEKVKKRTSSLLIIAFSRLKGWGLLWEEVKSPDSSIWYHQMKGWPLHEADWWQGWCGRTADSGAAVVSKVVVASQGCVFGHTENPSLVVWVMLKAPNCIPETPGCCTGDSTASALNEEVQSLATAGLQRTG